MAEEDYSITFGQQQLLIEYPYGSGLFGAPCGITGLTRQVQTNTSDVDLPPCEDPDALIWLGIDPVSKRMTLTFSGTLAKSSLQLWDSWSMSEGSAEAFATVRWYRNIGEPNQGYWEGRALLTNYQESSENRGRWQVSGTIVYDGLPRWHAIPPAPQNTAPVTISGTAEVGEVLTATPGTWSGTPSPTLTYQWLRNGALISGATGTTYTLVADDQDAMISVVETATSSAGSFNVTSASVGPVAAAP